MAFESKHVAAARRLVTRGGGSEGRHSAWEKDLSALLVEDLQKERGDKDKIKVSRRI